MATKPESNPWYPSSGTFPSYHQDFAVRQLYDHVYDLQSRFNELSGKHEELKGKMGTVTAENEKLRKIVNSQVAGYIVKTTLPQPGDTIRFNPKSGQFEFGA